MTIGVRSRGLAWPWPSSALECGTAKMRDTPREKTGNHFPNMTLLLRIRVLRAARGKLAPGSYRDVTPVAVSVCCGGRLLFHLITTARTFDASLVVYRGKRRTMRAP